MYIGVSMFHMDTHVCQDTLETTSSGIIKYV